MNYIHAVSSAHSPESLREDLYHQWRSIVKLLIVYTQVLATLASQLLEMEVCFHIK